MDIKGHTVHRVLVTEASDIAEEYYFSFLLDRRNRTFLAMCSAEGGMEIEQLAVERPDALARIPVDAITGVDEAKAAEIVAAREDPGGGGGPGRGRDRQAVGDLRRRGRHAGRGEPAGARPAGDKIVALDGKVTLDDNADFRHPEHADAGRRAAENPLEAKAKAKDLNYVKLDGGRSASSATAPGLVMSTLDVVAYAGEGHGGVKPANFLDIGGGASAEVMADGLDVILGDPDVKSVFVNVFGGITACDAVANGIVAGARRSSATRRTSRWSSGWTATTSTRAARILTRPSHPLVTLVDTMDDAADKAAELASCGGLTMAIFLNEDSQGHRPGHDRRRGHQAHHADAGGRHEHRRRRERRARPARRSTIGGARRCRCSARSRRR